MSATETYVQFPKNKGIIALLFHEPKAKILKLIADLQNIFQRTIEPIRPGRKYPRNHKVSARKFFLSYKLIGQVNDIGLIVGILWVFYFESH